MLTNPVQLYAEVFKTGEAIFKDIFRVLGVSRTRPDGANHPIALNTLPWHRKELVKVSDDEAGVACGIGQLLPVKKFKTNPGKKAVTVEEVRKGIFVLQNDQLKVTVEKGCITSLYDLVNEREVIEAGQNANKFLIFDDKPLYWQAWDVEVYHLDTAKELIASETRIGEVKEYQVSVVTKVKISEKSSLVSTITLSAALDGVQSWVECHAEVDWHETMKFLKVEFPVEVRNTEASYETAFGITRRPTHYNTTWDMAKFEVCCHRFADLSEPAYGVSILNDSKYGFSTCGNLMRLSLLRAPKAPDAHADMGKHSIKWAIFPHAGALGPATVKAAYAFNSPLRPLAAPKEKIESLVGKYPVTLTGDESLILDTVKRGEDDEDVSRGELPRRKGRSVILRVYESLGSQSRAVIQTSWKVKKVFKTNILEDDLEEIRTESAGKFKITLRPFEVATYRLQLHDGRGEL